MSMTLEDLEDFTRFATEQLSKGEATLEQLTVRWEEERKEREDLIRSVEQSMKDIETGRCQPWNEFFDEFCKKNNIDRNA